MVVGKVLNEIKTRPLLNLTGHRISNELSKNVVNNRSRLNIKPQNVKNNDYFTRLINSSPKPLVLRSLHHPVSIHLLKLSKSSHYRKYRELILLSSTKLIKEYCKLNGKCKRIYTTKHSNKLLLDKDIKFEKVIIVSKKLLQRISDLHSYDEGLVAEVNYPKVTDNLGLPKLVLCVCPSNKINNVNLSTIMRSAQALQWQAIWILNNNEIDLLDPKCIRSSQNTLSTMPYKSGTVQELIKFAEELKLLLCICSFNNPNGINLESIDMENKLCGYNGILLITGHCPQELYTLATHVYVNIKWKNYINSKTYYTLDPEIHSSIAMYIIKNNYFKNTPRSPFIYDEK